jgi:multicomponent Na+:H+ antiporter subunit E
MKKNTGISFLILMTVWILLNNTFQLNILIPGAIISLLISLFVCRRCDVFAEMKLTPKAIANTFIFLGVFFIELIKSNMDVTRRVLSPSLPINPGIVEVKTSLKSKFARMLLANSITLTPGTLTVEVKDESFFIHWIDVQSDDIDAASNEIVKKFEKYLEVIYG